MTAHPEGLTTTRAPFIERARHDGQLYIHQPYELYSAANHAVWSRLIVRMRAPWQQYANDRFLQGLEALCLPADRIPRLEDVNQFLAPLTGFRAKAVSGYIPAAQFFACLRQREFPTTITIRDGGTLDYLPEPDIFHDLAGHVPMHTDPAFADVLVRFGDCAHRAAARVVSIADAAEREECLTHIVKALARFFWFTIEFGLMRRTTDTDRLSAYGSGLLSSYGELARAIDSPAVGRRPFQIAEVVNQSFEYDHFQPLLFIVDSFAHLFDLIGELELWLESGRLDRVSAGGPLVGEIDLRSFIPGLA